MAAFSLFSSRNPVAREGIKKFSAVGYRAEVQHFQPRRREDYEVQSLARRKIRHVIPRHSRYT